MTTQSGTLQTMTITTGERTIKTAQPNCTDGAIMLYAVTE